MPRPSQLPPRRTATHGQRTAASRPLPPFAFRRLDSARASGYWTSFPRTELLMAVSRGAGSGRFVHSCSLHCDIGRGVCDSPAATEGGLVRRSPIIALLLTRGSHEELDQAAEPLVDSRARYQAASLSAVYADCDTSVLSGLSRMSNFKRLRHGAGVPRPNCSPAGPSLRSQLRVRVRTRAGR